LATYLDIVTITVFFAFHNCYHHDDIYQHDDISHQHDTYAIMHTVTRLRVEVHHGCRCILWFGKVK